MQQVSKCVLMHCSYTTMTSFSNFLTVYQIPGEGGKKPRRIAVSQQIKKTSSHHIFDEDVVIASHLADDLPD